MKNLKALAALALAGAVMTGCSEEQTAFDINAVPGKATVQGTVVYNEGTSYENGKFVYDYKPAADLLVMVIVPNTAYQDNLEGETVFEVTTDAEGKYSVEIPAPFKSTDITVRTADFAGVHKTIQRVNNVITPVEDNVVYGASSTCSVRSHSIVYCDMQCVERSAENIPEGLVEYATLKGNIGRGIEYYTAPAPFYGEDGTLMGYTSGSVKNCFEPAPSADLIVKVTYGNGEYFYNTTTDAEGAFTLQVPVAEFPATFRYEIDVNSYASNFRHYVALEEPREIKVNGITYTVNDYAPVNLEGYYEQYAGAAMTTGTLNYAIAAVTNTVDVKALVFTPFEGQEDAATYYPSAFQTNLPWLAEILEALQPDAVR